MIIVFLVTVNSNRKSKVSGDEILNCGFAIVTAHVTNLFGGYKPIVTG